MEAPFMSLLRVGSGQEGGDVGGVSAYSFASRSWKSANSPSTSDFPTIAEIASYLSAPIRRPVHQAVLLHGGTGDVQHDQVDVHEALQSRSSAGCACWEFSIEKLTMSGR